jgi:hypothetical protein
VGRAFSTQDLVTARQQVGRLVQLDAGHVNSVRYRTANQKRWRAALERSLVRPVFRPFRASQSARSFVTKREKKWTISTTKACRSHDAAPSRKSDKRLNRGRKNSASATQSLGLQKRLPNRISVRTRVGPHDELVSQPSGWCLNGTRNGCPSTNQPNDGGWRVWRIIPIHHFTCPLGVFAHRSA